MKTRIVGLDTLRFICACLVVIGHLGLPMPGFVPLVLKNFILMFFNGPAAVIVFFIISGFCIHYPNRSLEKFEAIPFLVRRIIRILLPCIVAIGLYLALGKPPQYPEYGVFWSIICEVVYYCLYPLLFALRRYVSFKVIALVCYVITLGMCLSNLSLLKFYYNSYVAFGLATWIIGLPSWLLGCHLAENYEKFTTPSTQKIMLLRVAVLLVSMALRVVKFKISSPLASNCITLNLFAFMLYFWIGSEIVYFQKHAISQRLENLGKWSYSLYLIHSACVPITGYLIAGQMGVLKTSVTLVLAFGLSYLFYILIENPTQNLAKRVSNAMRRKNPRQEAA